MTARTFTLAELERMLADATPGPWACHGAMLGHRGDVFSPTAAMIPDCHHIARCFAPKPTEAILSDLHAIEATKDAIAVIEANARFIAALPDLAQQLHAALVREQERDAEVAKLREALEPCVTMLEALAKEEGREVMWGEEDAFRRGEWFEQSELDHIVSARAALKVTP